MQPLATEPDFTDIRSWIHHGPMQLAGELPAADGHPGSNNLRAKVAVRIELPAIVHDQQHVGGDLFD